MEDVTPERWLPVIGWEGLYEVSDLGRVRSWHHRTPGRVLKPWTKPSGHQMVALSANGKQKSRDVHRLVAIAFIGPQPPGHEVCHRDGNPANNSALNLCWGTRSDNVQDAVRHGTHTWAARTHCPKGHPYDDENTIGGRRPSGKMNRVCRICHREASRRSKKRRRQEQT